jgi:DNA polymerase-3 subunit alpha
VLDEYPPAGEWDRLELLRREKAALGCYVSGHPLFRYGNKLERIGALATLKVSGAEPWSSVSIAGMVENYQERIFRGDTGAKAAFFEVEDVYGRVRAKLRGERIDTYAHVLRSGDPVLVTGKVSFPVTDEPDEEREPTLLVDGAEPLADAVMRATRAVSIRLDAERTERAELEKLRALLVESPGPCPVELVLALPGGSEAVLDLAETRVTPNDSVLAGLERMFGDSVAELR